MIARLADGLSARGLWAFLAVALPVLAALLADMSTVDLTYHVRAGEQVLNGGGIPSVDTYTFTAAGLPWQDQQWGAQAVVAIAWRLAGWSGLVLLRAALVGIIFAAVFVAVRRAGAAVRPAAVLTLVAFGVAAPALGLRPQLLGMALFALVLLLLAERGRHPRAVWLVPLLTIAWANVHGSFFLAGAAAGVAWLDDLVAKRREARRTLLLAVVTGIAAVMTPFGPWVYAYAIGLTTNPSVTDRITEWQPTSLRSVEGIAFFASALAAAWLLIRRGAGLRWPTLLWLAALVLIGAYAVRGIAWWPIGAAVALAPLVPRADPRRVPALREPRLARQLNAIIAILLVITGVVLLPGFRPSDPLTGPPGLLRDAPGPLTTALQGIVAPDDRVLNPQPWGSWLEFAVPAARTFVDSRVELFPVTVWDDYDRIVGGSADWAALLERYEVRVVVTSTAQGPAFPDRLRRAGGWLEAYADRDGTIFVRQ